MTRRRQGFALMTVLWVMVAVSLTGLAGALAAREGASASANRVEEERARWRAHDCFSRSRARIDSALGAARRDQSVARVWRRLDRLRLADTDDCSTTVEAVGSQVDVNAASATQLAALFRALGLPDGDGLAAAVVEWRELNGALENIRQIPALAAHQIPEVLGVEPGRIALNSAPIAVLASVPGFTPEVLARIAADREGGAPPIVDVAALAGSVSRPSADSIVAHYQEIVRLTTVDPDGWILRARGWSGHPRSFVVVEVRLALGYERTAMARVTAAVQ